MNELMQDVKTLVIGIELHRQVKAEASIQGRTIRDVVETLLIDWLLGKQTEVKIGTTNEQN